MNPYDELLFGLFTAQIPPWLPSSAVERFRSDSLKRRLDISQRLWEGWPQSSFYANAILREDYLFGVCSFFPDARFATSTMTEALEYALEKWLSTVNDRRIYKLFLYESLLHPNMRKEYSGRLKEELCKMACLPDHFTLATFEYNIIELDKMVRYFHAVHSPDIYVKEFEPPIMFTALAVYQQDQDIVARNIAPLLLELESNSVSHLHDLPTHLSKGIE